MQMIGGENMTSNEIVGIICSRENKSLRELSKELGHAPNYLTEVINKGRDLSSSLLSEICDHHGYDLVVRSREDGMEFFVSPR